MTILGGTILALVLVATLHFVYQGILLPSFRYRIRFGLFELRDRLRALRLRAPEIEDRLFQYQEDAINNTIGLLANFDLITVAMVNPVLEKDEKLAADAQARSRLLGSCPDPEFRSIYRGTIHLTTAAVLANSAPLLMYIVPPILVAVFFSALKRTVKEMLFMPSADVERVIPEGVRLDAA